MRVLSVFLLFTSIIISASSCTKITGCTEPTADNYNISAEKDDGTCIPGRDKYIGSYTYTRLWNDVVSQQDMTDFGTIQITETNTAHNHFVANFNGQLLLQGAVTAYDLLFENHVTPTSQYQGTGNWLIADSVELVLNVTYTDLVLAVPQPYTYYCTKVN